jgi:tetratricopeptide (TPR) repeat protein
VLAVLLYLPYLGAPFLWDDLLVLVGNPHLALSEIPSHFATDLFSHSRIETPQDRYSPLTLTLYSLLHAAAGEAPWIYHLASAILHGLVALLVARLALRLTERPGAALAAGLFFAVAPVHVETVVWASAMHTLLWSALALTSLLVATSRERALWRALGASLALAAALLSKESAVVTPLVLGVLDAARGGAGALRRNVPVYVALVLVLVGYFALRAALALPSGLGLLGGRGLVQRVGDATSVWRTLAAAAVGLEPGNLVRPFEPDGLLGAALTLAVVLAVGLALWRSRKPLALGGLCWFLVALLPFVLASGATGLTSDRYAYFATAGLGLLVAGLFPPTAHRRMLLFAGLLLVTLVARGALYAHHWLSDEGLFRHLLNETPGSAVAHHQLGRLLAARGRPAEAREALRQAFLARPDWGVAWSDLLAAELRAGHVQAVLAHAPAALARPDTDPAVHSHLASAYLSVGDVARARIHLERALARRPEDPRLWMVAALVALRGGDLPVARRLLEDLRKALREDAQYWRTYGLVLLRQGERAAARRALAQARKLAPGDPLLERLFRQASGE